eukprot:3941949-Rhodomonas_salina.3
MPLPRHVWYCTFYLLCHVLIRHCGHAAPIIPMKVLGIPKNDGERFSGHSHWPSRVFCTAGFARIPYDAASNLAEVTKAGSLSGYAPCYAVASTDLRLCYAMSGNDLRLWY